MEAQARHQPGALGGRKRGRAVQPVRAGAGSRQRRVLALAAVLVAATVAAYWNSLSGAFVLDDRTTVLDDPHLGRFDSLRDVLLGVRGGPTGGRPLTSLSFQLNALVAGRAPIGYHVVNLMIHASAGLALFALLLQLSQPSREARQGADVVTPAFAIALLWLVHPLQTEAVTYVSQRAESLMGLFFLLSVHAAVRGFQAARPAPWFRWAALASLASVLAKEVGVVAPVVIVLYDRFFVSNGFRAAWRHHRALYLGLSWTWVAAGLLQLGNPRGTSVSMSDAAISPLGYLARQLPGVLTYLKLAVWPSPLVFDYGFPPPAPSPGRVVVAAVLLLALAAASIAALRRQRLEGLAGVAFFLILAPSSSVVPILSEVLAEHRMYLPLACVLGAVAGGGAGVARWARSAGSLPHGRAAAAAGWTIVAAVAVALAVATWQRNAVYGSALSLWRDSAARVPDNPRAQSNLGMALMQDGRVEEALQHFRRAVTINPEYFEANGNLAIALERTGRDAEAVPYIRHAVALDPANARARQNLIELLERLGQRNEAVAAALDYATAFPDRLDANAVCATALLRAGRAGDAAPYVRRANELRAAAAAGRSP